MDGVTLTPLKKIHSLRGDVLHAMKKSDVGFDGFGEAYFSTVNKNDIKGWKKHTEMTLNLIVPAGKIEFVIYNDKDDKFFNVTISQDNYQRLTISPGFWLAFRGLDKKNILLNIASIEHDSSESVSIDMDKISYDWQ